MSDDRLATRSPREPDWIALRLALGRYYADRNDTAARDEAFGHVYDAIRYLARQVVSYRIHPSQGSVTDVSELIVDDVFQGKSFTEIAGSYDPERGSFKTWARAVLKHAFITWWRRGRNDPGMVPMGARDLDDEWEDVIADLVDRDLDGEGRTGVVDQLVDREDAAAIDGRMARMRVAMRRMPPLWQAIYLVDEDKETQKEAAARLGISLAGYKRKRKLAIAELTEVMHG